MSKIAVLGVGATGTLVAAALATAGRDVHLCARRPLPVLRVSRDGTTTTVAPPFATDPAEVGPVDVVLLAVKTHQVPSTAGWLTALVDQRTTVVVLQNGVDHVDPVARLAPAATVVPALVWCEAEAIRPGVVVSRGTPAIEVPDDDAGRQVATLFAPTVVEVRSTGDFRSAAWRKLCTNVAASGPTALTGCRLEVLGRPDVAALATALVAECLAVGRAEGAELGDDLLALVPAMAAMVGSGSSMLHDRLARRPLEHDAVYGPVLRGARRHSIAVPSTATVHALLAALSDASRA